MSRSDEFGVDYGALGDIGGESMTTWLTWGIVPDLYADGYYPAEALLMDGLDGVDTTDGSGSTIGQGLLMSGGDGRNTGEVKTTLLELGSLPTTLRGKRKQAESRTSTKSAEDPIKESIKTEFTKASDSDRTSVESRLYNDSAIQGLEKIFPSLLVTMKPCLKNSPEDADAAIANTKKEFYKIMGLSKQEFMIYLQNCGMIKTMHFCKTHDNVMTWIDRQEANKAPVWHSICCRKDVSPLQGSFFGLNIKEKLAPFDKMKLLYHWAMQTEMWKIFNLLKVPESVLINCYSQIRSICTFALQTKFAKMGGLRCEVLIGIYYFKMKVFDADGRVKFTVVKIFAALDLKKSAVRIRVVDNQDPLLKQAKTSQALGNLGYWVHLNSRIKIEQGIKEHDVFSIGFSDVKMHTGDKSSLPLLCYIKKVVKMLNPSNPLTLATIQQFMDELSWREVWGLNGDAFGNICSHLSSAMGHLGRNETFVSFVERIQRDPFTDEWYLKEDDDGKSVGGSSVMSAMSTPGSAVKDFGTEFNLGRKRRSKRKSFSPTNSTATTLSDSQSVKSIFATPSSTATSQDMTPPPVVVKIEEDSFSEYGLSANTDIHDGADGWTDLKTNRLLRRQFFKYYNQNKLDCNLCPNKGLKPLRPTFSTSNYYYISSQTVEMDSYYYGTRSGKIIDIPECCPETFKCPDCKEDVPKNNIFRHIVTHIQWKEKFSQTREERVCKYCLHPVKSTSNIDNHIKKSHKVLSEVGHCCRICCKTFEDEVKTTLHMWDNHCESEMPYKCPICKFQSSFLHVVVDHSETVHLGVKRIICPLCLKGFRLDVDLKEYKNISHHVKKHLLQAENVQCGSCSLKFVDDFDYITHVGDKSLHTNMNNTEGYERYNVTCEMPSLMMAPDPKTIAEQPPCPHRTPKPTRVTGLIDTHEKVFAQVMDMIHPSQDSPSPPTKLK